VEVKVIDLGSAKMVDSEEDDNLNHTFIMSDTSAPEMNKKEKYGFSSDMWPIGMIALFLLTGKCKFFQDAKEELEINGKFECSLELIDFINCLLQKDPKKRLNYKNVLNHPFFRRKAENFQMKGFQRTINITKSNKNFEINETNQPIWEDIEMTEESGKKQNVNDIFIDKPIEDVPKDEGFNPYEEYEVNQAVGLTYNEAQQLRQTVAKQEKAEEKKVVEEEKKEEVKEKLIQEEKKDEKAAANEKSDESKPIPPQEALEENIEIEEGYLDEMYSRKVVSFEIVRLVVEEQPRIEDYVK